MILKQQSLICLALTASALVVVLGFLDLFISFFMELDKAPTNLFRYLHTVYARLFHDNTNIPTSDILDNLLTFWN